jgi:hypothetical protein
MHEFSQKECGKIFLCLVDPKTIHVPPLSETIDTPANRAAMPAADTSTWTPPAFIAERAFEWAHHGDALQQQKQSYALSNGGVAFAVRTVNGQSELRRLRESVAEE